VVSQGPDEGAKAVPPAECEANRAHHRPVRLSWARLLKLLIPSTAFMLPVKRFLKADVLAMVGR
jgi:hypothetical protein